MLSPLNLCFCDFKKVTELDLTLRNVLLFISSKAVNLLLHMSPIRKISSKSPPEPLPGYYCCRTSLQEFLPSVKSSAFIRQPCGILRRISSSSWTSACPVCCRNSRSWRRGCRRRGLTAPQTEPSDRCLFLPGPTVYFHEGINVYFDMPLALF